MNRESQEIRHDDRRAALRQTSRVESLIVEHATAGTMIATVLDLSREGFRLLLPTSIPCGDELLLHPPVGMDLLKIRGTVIRQCVAVRDGVKKIECGVEVADTAAWRKHSWFLALRTSSVNYEAVKQASNLEAAS